MSGRRATRWRLPRGLLLALAIALLARTLLPIIVWQVRGTGEAFMAQDSSKYVTLAESLAASGDYATEGRPELRRVPGFPALLALAARIGDPIAVTLAAHVALGGATTLLCFSIARHLAGESAGVIAALLFACAADLWIWNTYLLSETLFVFLLAAMIWSVARFQRSDQTVHLVLAVVLACACAYVRIVGYPLPFLLVGWLAWRGGRNRRSMARAAASLALAAALLGAWHLRNGLVAGYWGFSSQIERSLYFLGGGVAESVETEVSYFEARRRLQEHLGAAGESPPDDSETIAAMRSRGLSAVLSHPVSFTVAYGVGLAAVLLHSNTGYALRLFQAASPSRRADGSGLYLLTRGHWRSAARYLRQRGAVYWLILLVQTTQLLVYYALCALAFRRPGLPRGAATVLLVAICLLLLSGGAHGNARYRAPLMPSICVLAAIGLVRRRKSAAVRDGLERLAGWVRGSRRSRA